MVKKNMKNNNFYTINPLISVDENMKKLAIQEFKKEISFDVLREKLPDYSNLYINGVHFCFKHKISSWGTIDESKDIKYLRLNASLLYRNRYNTRKKSIKITEQKTIDIKYLRKVFDNFKTMLEEDKTLYTASQDKRKKEEVIINEIKNRNLINYPETKLYLNNRLLSDNILFQLEFYDITEREVDKLMDYWNSIIKSKK